MFERLFSLPWAIRRYKENPFAHHLEIFASDRVASGYARASIRYQVRLLADLGLWMKQRRKGAEHLNERMIANFIAEHVINLGRGDRRALELFLDQLRRDGVVAPIRPREIDSRSSQLQRDYDAFLAKERGLSSAAVLAYRPFVQRFLVERRGCIKGLTAEYVSSFVARHAANMGRKRGQLMTSALRSFLRFLLQKGMIRFDLAGAVPSVANWRQTSLPSFLTVDQVEAVVRASRSRNSRDYAILLLLARLGLRACEIVRLELDDLNWRDGELVVRGKGGVLQRMPLPKDVGKALAIYLKSMRPRSGCRRVFLRSRAPYRGFANSIAISTIAVRSLRRAGIAQPTKWGSSHLFRRSLATKMIRRGVPLSQIGQVLRHRSLTSTEIYAKVDIEGLRSLARPWPVGGRK